MVITSLQSILLALSCLMLLTLSACSSEQESSAQEYSMMKMEVESDLIALYNPIVIDSLKDSYTFEFQEILSEQKDSVWMASGILYVEDISKSNDLYYITLIGYLGYRDIYLRVLATKSQVREIMEMDSYINLSTIVFKAHSIRRADLSLATELDYEVYAYQSDWDGTIDMDEKPYLALTLESSSVLVITGELIELVSLLNE